MHLMKGGGASSCTCLICICIILFPWSFHCYKKKSMSFDCVWAFIYDFTRTWTSVYVNVGWNNWDSNMAGYGLVPGWSMKSVLCQGGYRAHPTCYPLGPWIWSWPLSCGAEMKLYCLSFIYLWSMVLNHRDNFLFTFTLCVCVCLYILFLLSLKLKFETV